MHHFFRFGVRGSDDLKNVFKIINFNHRQTKPMKYNHILDIYYSIRFTKLSQSDFLKLIPEFF